MTGLRNRDIVRLLTTLLESFSKDTGTPEDSRTDSKRLDAWQDAAIAEAKKRDSGEPPERLALGMLQPSDKRHVSDLRRIIGNEPQAILYYLERVVFERTQRMPIRGGGYAVEKLSASGMDLGSDLLFECSIGFSGTPSNLIPPAMKDCIATPGDDANTINVLTDPEVMDIDLVDKIRDKHDLLRRIAKDSRRFGVLIDAGALVTGMTNEQVARFMLKELSWAKAAVFMDSQDRKQCVYAGGGPPQPFLRCNVSKGERFTFFE